MTFLEFFLLVILAIVVLGLWLYAGALHVAQSFGLAGRGRNNIWSGIVVLPLLVVVTVVHWFNKKKR